MRKVWSSKFRFVSKSLVTEGTEIFGLIDAVLNDESCHGSPACLSPNSLNLQLAAFSDVEERLNDSDFFSDTVPVKQVLVFLCSKMYQNSTIRFHRINQYISQVRRLFQKPNIFCPSPLGSSTLPSILYGRMASNGRSSP